MAKKKHNGEIIKFWGLDDFKKLIGVEKIRIELTPKSETKIWKADLFGEQYVGFCADEFNDKKPIQVLLLEEEGKKKLMLCNTVELKLYKEI